MTREEWLNKAAERTARLCKREVPRLYYSVGFPKGARVGRGRRAIGQCWDGQASADKAPHIFISPELADAVEVLAVLVHEQLHAAVGCQHGHRGPFSKAMREAGMVKPWTTSTPGPELRAALEAEAAALGEYPHAALRVADRPRPGSRLRLYECGCTPRPVKLRVASDDLDATCNVCGQKFERQV